MTKDASGVFRTTSGGLPTVGHHSLLTGAKRPFARYEGREASLATRKNLDEKHPLARSPLRGSLAVQPLALSATTPHSTAEALVPFGHSPFIHQESKLS
ncbi:hypothetical protein [Halococcus agarilyticus]|uniref:hypothetical protein n=1 Tax=Halococcus agarilyticus TaxID=1232219 RepID=UPI000677BF58|nr:hypothetical protein [Halococcus agarilyticus]